MSVQSPWLQDMVLQVLPVYPSLNHLIPPMHGQPQRMISYIPLPSFFTVHATSLSSWSSSALAENMSESPFKVPSPMCNCHNPLSPQSFNPWPGTLTSRDTKLLHHTHRLRGSKAQAMPSPWIQLQTPAGFPLIPNVASRNPFKTQNHRPRCRLPLKYSKQRVRGNREGRIKHHQKRDWAPWLPCTWMKDWFLAFADDVVVQAAHEQGIPELLIYYGVPSKHKHKSYFWGFLVPAYLRTMQPCWTSLATAASLERWYNTGKSPPSFPILCQKDGNTGRGKKLRKKLGEQTHAFKAAPISSLG